MNSELWLTDVVGDSFESSDRSPVGIPVEWWDNAIYTHGWYRGGTDPKITENFGMGGYSMLDEDGNLIGEGLELDWDGRTEVDIEEDIRGREMQFFEEESELVESLLSFLSDVCGFPEEWIWGMDVTSPFGTAFVPGIDKVLRKRIRNGDEPFAILMDFRKVAGMLNRRGWKVFVGKKLLGWLYAWKRMMDDMDEWDREEQSDPSLETNYVPEPQQNSQWWDKLKPGPHVWSNEELVSKFVHHIINIQQKADSFDDFMRRCNQYITRVRSANRTNSQMPLRDLHKVVGIMLAASEVFPSHDRVEIAVSKILSTEVRDQYGNVRYKAGRAIGFIPKSAHKGDFIFNVHSKSKFAKDEKEFGWVYAKLKLTEWTEEMEKVREYWIGNLKCGRALIRGPEDHPPKDNKIPRCTDNWGPKFSWDKKFQERVRARANSIKEMAKLGRFELVEMEGTRYKSLGDGRIVWVEVPDNPFLPKKRRERGKVKEVPRKQYVQVVSDAAKDWDN